MTETQLATAVRAVIDNWMQTTQPAAQRLELAKPRALAAKLGGEVLGALLPQGYAAAAIRECVLQASCYHLQNVFDPGELVDTPMAFFPVPDTAGTIAARAAALAVHCALGLETISYGTENDGNLFVNLVAFSGNDVLAEKSKKSMRGHTDAVSFPLNGQDDPGNLRIAPSPDLVTLVGLRNPDEVATKLMPLKDVLQRMSGDDVLELKRPQFSIRSQKTFIQGMKRVLGAELVVIATPILVDVPDGSTYVRYSHSSVVPIEEGGPGEKASNSLEAACNESAQGIVVKPGDILIVNNRLSLHGRGKVSDDVGGLSRWLLRTYGLDTSKLSPNKRKHGGSEPTHVLFP